MAGIVIPIDTKEGRQELDKLQKEFRDTGRSAQKAENSLKKVEGRVTKGLGAQRGRKALASFNKGLKMTAKSLLSLQGMLAGFTLAATIATISVVGAKFEKQMATVGAVTRATAKEFQMLEDMARKMGATTEWTASQAAGALRFLGMAGFEATKAASALPGVLDLATASGVDLARSADIASNALTAMQLEVGELGRVNDVFVATMTRSNVDMEMLAESFKYSAPLAQALGYDIEQLSAMIGILGNAGIQGSMAGTQLAFAMQQLPKLFKELGVSGEGKNLIDALELINQAGWESERVMKVFGQRGGRAVLVLKDLIPQYKALEAANRGAAGETKTLADTIRDTVIGDFNTLKSTMESLAIDTFQRYKGEIRAALQGTIQYIRTHKSEIQDMIKGLGDLIVVLTKSIAKIGEWTGAFAKGIAEAARTAGEGDWTSMSGVGTTIRKMVTGEGVIERDMREYQMKQQRAMIEAKWEKIQSRRGGPDYDLKKFFGEIDRAEQALIDKQAFKASKAKVSALGIDGGMTSEDRNKRDRILQRWQETKETYRLNDEEMELRSLQKEYDIYAEHLKNKKDLDRWYEDEKTRIKTEAALQRDEEERRRQEDLTAGINTDLENFFGDVDAAEEKLQSTRSSFSDFSDSASNMMAQGLTDSLWNITSGFDAARLSFGNFAASFVRDITTMIAKQLLFNSISTMMGGGGGLAGGLLGGLFGRASGGPVSPNQSYWVGERGPERFVPQTKGRIEPAESQEKSVSIVNVMDPSLMEDWASSEAGQNAILNVVTNNSDTVKFAMR